MGAKQSTEFEKVKKLDHVKFHLEDVEHTVKTDDISPTTSLNSYVRNTLQLTGTKGMCYEGGCGACLVVLQRLDTTTQQNIVKVVNSCLVPVLACSGWKIYTIEGIGNPLLGYHPIQQALANFNGTQCGFCSPGMVMNMYALMVAGKMTMEQIENSFGGNICRCTGYRPILTAFKSLAKDANTDLLGIYPDIEDLKLCKKECKETCLKQCELSNQIQEPFYHEFATSKWIKVYSLQDVLSTLTFYKDSTYKFVAGNTAKGVYPTYGETVDIYIDVNFVQELISHEVQDNYVVFGANTTLTNAMSLLTDIGTSHNQFSYFKQMAKHIDLVANVPVRNVGTLAGNLMIKHDHHEFPSDIFLLLEAVGAKLTIININRVAVHLSPRDFITFDMKDHIIQDIVLPSYTTDVKFQSYKIMPRAQNVHAYVNAGFLYKFNNQIITSATVVIGNINPEFVRATQTEKFLVGKNPFDNATLQNAFTVLAKELVPDVRPPEPSPEFRKQLALSLFYKAVLSFAPDGCITAKNKSGATLMKRPVSSGAQDFETNKSLYPLTQAIPKLEALAQTSGQAKYIIDIPDSPHQLYGALVLAEAPANSVIAKIDTTKALAISGVVAYYDQRDIPGENNFQIVTVISIAQEEIFCKGRVLYYEQPIGIIVATTQQLASKAASLVDVEYIKPNVSPLLSVRQVLANGRTDRVQENRTITATRKGTDVKNVVTGSFDILQQYHLHMETQTCQVIPTEDGLEIYSSTQWMDLVQVCVAKMLKINVNKICVTVRRCGGAFGAKISRSGLPACASALAAWKLRRPVRMHMTLSANMAALGKRWPLSTDYEVGLNNQGVIQYLNCTHYTDVGAIYSEECVDQIQFLFQDNYISDTFTMHFCKVITDTATNTWTRGPGSTEGYAAIEAIMEHLSYALNIDPLQFRLANIAATAPVLKHISDFRTWADVDKRKQDIDSFNKLNRWKKKGFAVIPMTYEFVVAGPYTVMISVFWGDASVQIQHGGIEIGQGINTKAAQVCAYKFGIALDRVSVIPSTSFVGANSTNTGGSATSEAICYGVIQACDDLLERMKPYQKDTWDDTVSNAYSNNVRLSSLGFYSATSPNVANYPIYGVCACEVLLDVLTGQHIVSRVDLLEDVGQSMSPDIDIGQVEGAYIMGLGYYTMEKIVFNYEGKILTNNTWTYHPPGPKDIPVDFRIQFPKNNPNPVGVLKSKAIAEPPLCMSVAVPLAIRNAMASARTDSNSSSLKWVPFTGVTDIENVFMNSLNTTNQYTL